MVYFGFILGELLLMIDILLGGMDLFRQFFSRDLSLANADASASPQRPTTRRTMSIELAAPVGLEPRVMQWPSFAHPKMVAKYPALFRSGAWTPPCHAIRSSWASHMIHPWFLARFIFRLATFSLPEIRRQASFRDTTWVGLWKKLS